MDRITGNLPDSRGGRTAELTIRRSGRRAHAHEAGCTLLLFVLNLCIGLFKHLILILVGGGQGGDVLFRFCC